MLGVKGRATSKGRGRGKGDERPGLAPFGVGRGRGKGDGELDGLLNGGLPRSKSHPSSLKDEDDEAYAEGLVGRAVSCLPAMDSADTKPSLAELVDSDDGSVACWFYRDPKNSVQVKDAAASCCFALQLDLRLASGLAADYLCRHCRVRLRKPSSSGGLRLGISRTSFPCGTRMAPTSSCRCARSSNSRSPPTDLSRHRL